MMFKFTRKRIQEFLQIFILLLTMVDFMIVVGLIGWHLGSFHRESQFFLTIVAVIVGQFIGALVVNIVGGVITKSLKTIA